MRIADPVIYNKCCIIYGILRNIKHNPKTAENTMTVNTNKIDRVRK